MNERAVESGAAPTRKVIVRLNPDPDFGAEISVRLSPDPAVSARQHELLTMLAELARARGHVRTAEWRVPHPVKTHYCVKVLRQIERQCLAELEELFGASVEIDPPTTGRPPTQAAAATEDTMGTTQYERINASDNEPGRLRRAANKTWQFVKNPKVWGVGAAIAGIGVVYLIVRAVAGGDETAVVAQPGATDGPIGGGDTATSTTVDPAVNG
jgi:hypothetical protein